MDNTTPRPKPAPPKVGPHATQIIPVEAKDETPEVRCKCGRFPSQVNPTCDQTHKKPYVMKPHLTNKPFKENENLVAIQKMMHHSEPKRPAKRTPRQYKEKN